MKIYYSGSGSSTPNSGFRGEPEVILGRKAAVMFSYYLIRTDGQKQHLRFPRVVGVRVK